MLRPITLLPFSRISLQPTRSFSSQSAISLLAFRNMSSTSTSTHTQLTLPSGKAVSVPTSLFINNEWRPSSTGETYESFDPSTGKKVLNFAHASEKDVDDAVKAARKAFQTTWGKNIAGADRAIIINRFADLIERDAAHLAALESFDAGKGVKIALDSDVGDTISCLRFFAGLADKIHGQTIDCFGNEKMVYTLHEPIGVCGQIIPWNYPMLMWAWKVAPALAAGCCVVMKPSELSSLTALALCELAVEAGIPPGVINTVTGLGATTGNAIASHMDIDKVAFTGSVITGRRISVAAANSNLKKVTLELGGKSPSLVFDSANLEEAALWSALGIWFNSGQDCCAGSRILVQDSVYDKFVAILTAKAQATGVGLPSDETTSFGPLISAGQRDKVLGYVNTAKKEGATVHCGGTGWDGSKGGYYVLPTIITDADPSMQCVREEIFGPVVCIMRFKTEEEAIRIANDTEYGLAAAVFSNDARQTHRVSGALQAGTIWINQYALLHAQAPFGGFKQSGIGRELGTYGLEAYTQVKAVHHNYTQTIEWPLIAKL